MRHERRGTPGLRASRSERKQTATHHGRASPRWLAARPSGSQRSRGPQADDAVLGSGLHPIAKCRTDVLRTGTIVTATDDIEVNLFLIAAGRPGAGVRRRPFVAPVKAILDPFIDIAVHVMEAESVGGKRTDRR